MTFKCGDVVRLKSGGPNMTIGNVLIRGAVNATWFEGELARVRVFHIDMLEKVS